MFYAISTVLISGSNLFGHAGNITSVTFGDLQAEIDYSNTNNSLVRVRVRSSDVSVDTDVRVVITAETMARVASSGSDWTYLVPGRVGDVRPNTGQNGTVVTITGEHSQVHKHTNTQIHTSTHTHTNTHMHTHAREG